MSPNQPPPQYNLQNLNSTCPAQTDLPEIVRSGLDALQPGNERILVQGIKQLGDSISAIKKQFEAIILALAKQAKGSSENYEATALCEIYESYKGIVRKAQRASTSVMANALQPFNEIYLDLTKSGIDGEVVLELQSFVEGFPTSDPLDGHDDEYHHVEKKLLSLVEEIQNKEHKPEGEGIAAGVSVPAMCASKGGLEINAVAPNQSLVPGCNDHSTKLVRALRAVMASTKANRAKGLKDVLVDRHSVVADLRTLHREMSSVTPALKGFSKIYKVVEHDVNEHIRFLQGPDTKDTIARANHIRRLETSGARYKELYRSLEEFSIM